MAASARRLAELRAGLAGFGPAPDLDVVGSAEHRGLSRELAERSLTRLDAATDGTEPAPVALAPTARILAIMPQPADLTPADTSSAVVPATRSAFRANRSTRAGQRPAVSSVARPQTSTSSPVAAYR